MEGYSYQSAEIYPYDKDSYDPVIVPIGTGVTAYDCPVLRRPLLLVINEGLYYGTKMMHSLWNPNQIRSFGHKFQDNPFDDTPLCSNRCQNQNSEGEGLCAVLHMSPTTTTTELQPRLRETLSKCPLQHVLVYAYESLLVTTR